LFDGISTGRLALENLGISVASYEAWEWEDKPKSVSRLHWSSTDYHGDVRECIPVEGDTDLLIGGSSCNDLSSAMANRQGLKGSKSSIFWEYVAIWRKSKPKYFLFENVGGMSREDKQIICDVFNCEPITIKGELFAPSLRKRHFWTNIPIDMNTQKYFHSGKELNDILEDGYSPRKYARCLLASDSRPLTTPIKMWWRSKGSGFTTPIFKSKEHYESCEYAWEKYFKPYVSSASGLDKLISSGKVDEHLCWFDGIRYMNQTELEKCLGFDGDYTKNLNRNEAAHVLGMSWTLPAVEWLLSQLGNEYE
jgi:hypothetical protein